MADIGWAQGVADRIGEEVRRLRGDRPLRWLEDRTVELGHRVSRSTLNDLENRRRAVVPITDLIVLAAALEVPVATLLYGDLLLVEMLPGLMVERPVALEALAGTAAEADDAREEIKRAYETMEEAREVVRKLMARHGISESWSGRRVHIDELRDGG